MGMRIIAGTLKGTRLFAPKSKTIRPTSDRVREYIFSCINFDIIGSTVLDLFAGTGAFGIEAISRGAADAFFVDNSSEAISLIRKNLLKVDKNCRVEKKSADLFLRTTKNSFDFIFCDPPYSFCHFEKIVQLILKNHLVAEAGSIIHESSSHEPTALVPGIKITRQKKMGDTLVTFYATDYENSNLSRNI